MSALPALIVSGDLLPGGGPLNGRRWAGQQLLRLWGQAAASEAITLMLAQPAQVEPYAALLREAGHTGPVRGLPFTDPTPLQAVGGLFLADASIGRWAQWRLPSGSAAFSLIGQIHTICTPAAVAQIQELVSEPLAPWDALICSSSAGKAVVEALILDREQQLATRCGGDQRLLQASRPQLPVIPLPIPAAELVAALPSRDQARAALGIAPEAHVLLWLGRLSMLTKLDPWPVYQLLERLARQLSQPLVLIECGPDDTPHQAQHLAELRALCPDVRFCRLGGEQPVSEASKHQALAAADVGLFLVDNLQETFGLAVAEAMAAGLPIVASNWDGYRDLLSHGVEGFLVPSRFATSAAAVAFPLAWQQLIGLQPYPVVAGALAQLVQLDAEAAQGALLTLLQNPALARAMGAAARRRALRCFESTVVMQVYAQLFDELADRRRLAPHAARRRCQPSLALDPVRAFAAYPSHGPAPTVLQDAITVPAAVRAGRAGLWQLLKQDLDPALTAALQADLLTKHRPPHE